MRKRRGVIRPRSVADLERSGRLLPRVGYVCSGHVVALGDHQVCRDGIQPPVAVAIGLFGAGLLTGYVICN